jgi:hypothetical protein
MGFAEKAAQQARRLAETAKAKADEYGLVEKAGEYTGKAAELAGRGVDAATAGVDKATGGRFHDQLDTVNTKVAETLERARQAGAQTPPPPDTPPAPGEPPTPATSAGDSGVETRGAADASGQDGAPITPASTNPEAERPKTE